MKNTVKKQSKNKLMLDAASPVWAENGRQQQQQQQEKENKSSHSKERNSTEKPLHLFHQIMKWFPIFYQLKQLLCLKSLLHSLHLKKHSLKKFSPSHSPDGPMLDFEILGDRNNCIDLQRTHLGIVACAVQNNCIVLRAHATKTAQQITPYLVNNPLSSLFSECTMSLNGEKFQQLMPILPIRVSLRPNFHTVMMQKNMACSSRLLIWRKSIRFW